MPLVNSLLWSTLIAGGITIASVAGALLVRRWASVEVLERHNEVAGFIYAVIGEEQIARLLAAFRVADKDRNDVGGAGHYR